MELLIRTTIGSEAQRYLLLAFVILIVGALAASYYGSYLQSKGTQKALEEGLQSLTLQVSATTKAAEEIKAQIGTSTWVLQQRWNVKRELYTDLLSALYKLADIYYYVINSYVAGEKFGAPNFKDVREKLEKQRKERSDAIPPLWEIVTRVRGFGELTLATETIQILDQLHKKWIGDEESSGTFLDELEARRDALREAHAGIVASAKKDLEL